MLRESLCSGLVLRGPSTCVVFSFARKWLQFSINHCPQDAWELGAKTRWLRHHLMATARHHFGSFCWVEFVQHFLHPTAMLHGQKCLKLQRERQRGYPFFFCLPRWSHGSILAEQILCPARGCCRIGSRCRARSGSFQGENSISLMKKQKKKIYSSHQCNAHRFETSS